MQATPKFRTWHVFSDDGKHFRWSSSGRNLDRRSEQHHETLIPPQNPESRLPSMRDLLLQGSLKLIEETSNDSPMFQTGSGKSVGVKKSSILKALSVLGEGEISERGSLKLPEEASINSSSMFRTGLGKPVAVKQSSIKKASSVLGEDDNVERGSLKLPEEASSNSSSMFRTGLGKPMAVKQSSIKKASFVLGEDDNVERDPVRKYSADHSCTFSNLFQTASGKMVDVSSSGLLRAKTLLGLDENYNHNNFQLLEQSMKQSGTNELNRWENSLHLEKRPSMISGTAGIDNILPLDTKSVQKNLYTCQRDIYSPGNQSSEDACPNFLGSEVHKPGSKEPPIKFQTAGGRSISVSGDALQRARSLLGDTELEMVPNKVGADDPLFSVFMEEKIFNEISSNKENVPYVYSSNQNFALGNQRQSAIPSDAVNSGDDMLKQVSAKRFPSKGYMPKVSCMQKPSSVDIYASHTSVENSCAKDPASRIIPHGRSSSGPLVEISNSIEAPYTNQNHITGEKARRFGRRSSISPFKRPRHSRFSNPLTHSSSLLPTGSSTLSTSEVSGCKTKVSYRYPSQVKRKTIEEFFGGPPCHHNLLRNLQDELKCMNVDSAEKYIFQSTTSLDGIGAEALRHMLFQSGASLLNATQEWVANHYKWIVWKLACFERCYPAQASGRYLTVSNVFEELKYRYEREVNHGHRSALKRILEGDASPAFMVVLCISAIHSYPVSKLESVDHPMSPDEDTKKLSGSDGAENSNVAKIELTDGWYSVDALLDVPLSQQLVAGKLFVGQKLRIWGANLCGWIGPVSPLEASKTVRLVMHINGTYRAHWADRLGFCKGFGAPLAFRCIKVAGGPVPRTLVGVTRIYPILYKERFTNEGSVVRSERMEAKMLQLYNQRRSIIAEGIISESHNDIFSLHSMNDNESEEGAKIFKILETAADPEGLMADMSSEQLFSFSNYQAKQEAIRQSGMQKRIEKALKDAGLSDRQVTPLMRVRVVGLTYKRSHRKGHPREGLITIWNPTEKQQVDLVEGQIYSVAGLIPLNSYSDIIHLQARGSNTVWELLPPLAMESFEPFFTPRKSVSLSNLGEVPLSSEFDIAAVILYVGEVYLSGHQKKQWVFMADGSDSGCGLESERSSKCLLAVSFCLPMMDNDSFAPINYTFEGSTVGFCNLVKRARDQMNHLWVAEATKDSTYSSCYNLPGHNHLKEAADSARKWSTFSSLDIHKLRERALHIVGVGKS